MSPSLMDLLTICPPGGAVIAGILALATASSSGEELAQRVLLYSAVGALVGTYLGFVIAIGGAVAQ